MEPIIFQPIGTIKTPFKTVQNMPIQPCGAKGKRGIIELNPELVPGLMDLEGFSHIILLYHFHLIKGHKLCVVPFMDDVPHGIFATRAPARPNPIGLSIVRVRKFEGHCIHVLDVDMVNGTPLIDIKPFFPKYDNRDNVKYGWLEGNEGIDITRIKSDTRFDHAQMPETNRHE
jgi:tRNA (adenine37-N6)-methyltransferase